LNRAVAVLQLHGASAALPVLELIADKRKVESFYLYHSLLGQIHLQLQDYDKAKSHFAEALHQTHSRIEKKLLQNKIEKLEKNMGNGT
jgi:predicted RNA polymerase sigma factor